MPDPIELCRYQYDALDRLATRTPLSEAVARRFYKGDRLATELQGAEYRTVLRTGDQLLAHKNQSGIVLLGTDQQNSVLHADDTAIAYAPYGHREKIDVLPGLPGFNGEQPDPVTGHYLLGNGYRAYNPVLMRFNSPDSLSPFGSGGLNAYNYCLGDPINRVDPTGHLSWPAGMGLGLSVLGILVSLATLGAATPLAIAGLATGVASGAAGVAQAITEKSSPEASSVLGWVGLGLGVASAGFGVAAGFQKVGSKVASSFKHGLSGKGAIGLGPGSKASGFRPMSATFDDMPPHIKARIMSYASGKDAAALGGVSSDFSSVVMESSMARFRALKYADLSHQEWLGKLDKIYFGEVDGIAPMLLQRNGIAFSDIRAELIRPSRFLGNRFWIFPRYLKYGPVEPVDPAMMAMQLNAGAGGGF